MPDAMTDDGFIIFPNDEMVSITFDVVEFIFSNLK